MKTGQNILIAFLLNLAFAIFECIGGIMTGSVAILSDALHDLGDALSIGISYFLEKKSRQKPDSLYTYGYGRYSVLGSFLTTLVLVIGSGIMIFSAIQRLIHPTSIHYDGMLLFAIAGVIVNGCAAFFTRHGDSLNQKAVNLHMLEDVLGWGVVLVGAVVMRFTDLAYIDPILSLGVSVYILIHALGNMRSVADLFLEKVPNGLKVSQIKAQLEQLDGVQDVHHIHLWSLDGQTHCATLHAVTDRDTQEVKAAIRRVLQQQGIHHVTIETESPGAVCHHRHCQAAPVCHHRHCHHHRHTA